MTIARQQGGARCAPGSKIIGISMQGFDAEAPMLGSSTDLMLGKSALSYSQLQIFVTA
jgi:hypothetical protein